VGRTVRPWVVSQGHRQVGWWRAVRPLAGVWVKTAAVILNWNRAGLTRIAAESVREQVDAVYLVDNGSATADAAAVAKLAAELGGKLVPLDENRGYAGGNNAGIMAAIECGFDAILVLNNDVVVTPGAVGPLVQRLEESPRLGACAPLVISHDTGNLFHSHCELDLTNGSFGWQDYGRPLAEVSHEPRPTGYVSGEAVLMRTEAIRECGAFDERFFLTFEDTEWSARVRRAGWTLEAVPASTVVHHHKATMGDATSAFYMSRNYPLFLHLAFEIRPLVAFARGTGFSSSALLAALRRRNWNMARGTFRGWTASAATVARAACDR
jgi:GT2 family glycosyltransferase